MSHRILQINRVIRDEVSLILIKSLNLKQFGLITITDVKTVPDLSKAQIFIQYSSQKDHLKTEAVLKHLKNQTHDIQQELSKRLKLRRVPKIFFEINHEMDRLNRIEEILNKD